MNSGHTVQSLREFEEDIANEFNLGHIRAPVHLEDGNEAQLIEVFKTVRPEDWICCSWRSHLKCLLKGVPSSELKTLILSGASIALNIPGSRIVSSAIVGGILPIAVGLAMGIKRRGENARVHVFLGDMTARTGIAFECQKYAYGHMLNMRFVTEDNGLSVCTPTGPVWGEGLPVMEDHPTEFVAYRYKSKWPHAGAGQRVEF